MIQFIWIMTKDDWERLKRVDNCAEGDDLPTFGSDYFGACLIGKLCFEFHHTLDDFAWYPYVDCYMLGKDGGYYTMSDGTPYDYIDNHLNDAFFQMNTFFEFQKKFEKEVMHWAVEDKTMEKFIDCECGWKKYYR